jgi:sulfate adenylyltransferase (ADP) / ATP adenylyltransferase
MCSVSAHQSLQSGTLWPALKTTTQHALNVGALHPIATTYDWIEQGEVCFLVRVLANLHRKAEAKKAQKTKQSKGEAFNPFLPYEADLFVSDLSPTHVAILNKFNVVDHHLLMITRVFASQDHCLTLDDFVALTLCLAEVEGLGFYNGGKDAGASQPHKHLQLVPFPLVPELTELPIAAALEKAPRQADGVTSPALPFRHRITWLKDMDFSDPLAIAPILHRRYLHLLRCLNLLTSEAEPPAAYNLLVTRQWMVVVPRSQESHSKISVNSLGFAGALLVKTPTELEQLRQLGPMNLLKAVSFPQD